MLLANLRNSKERGVAGVKCKGQRWEMRLERDKYMGKGQQEPAVLGLNQTRAGVLLESVMTWDSFVQILKDK